MNSSSKVNYDAQRETMHNIKPWVLKNGEKFFSRMKRNSI